MQVTVNGEAQNYPSPLTISALLESRQVDYRKVAVEVNKEIIPKSNYHHLVQENDIIEIIGFIGGG